MQKRVHVHNPGKHEPNDVPLCLERRSVNDGKALRNASGDRYEPE
jgi:hypothetical protein